MRIIKDNNNKTKLDYEDILKDNMNIKIRMISTIDNQIEEIKQILGEYYNNLYNCMYLSRLKRYVTFFNCYYSRFL